MTEAMKRLSARCSAAPLTVVKRDGSPDRSRSSSDRAVALLVFLAAAARAGIVASGLRRLAHRFEARTEAFPQLAKIVHAPDGGGKVVQTLLAHAGCTVRAPHGHVRFTAVALGQ